jgi:triphosphoribosyl-dephospho-CoA synthetase
MAHADDTNIIYRGGVDVFRSIQEDLRGFLDSSPDMEAIREKAACMDREFIRKNISPGGCADLLGITFFLWRMALS